MVLKGLGALLSLQSDLEVCGEALDAATAWAGVTAARPRVVIVDLSLGRDDGVDLIQRLHQHFPEVKILVFSMHAYSVHMHRAFQAGASAYVPKQEGVERIIDTIELLMEIKPDPIEVRPGQKLAGCAREFPDATNRPAPIAENTARGEDDYRDPSHHCRVQAERSRQVYP